tara:strand:+ start:69 stop:635 length:567 start_codon:yes stop_codon:yes gene_type:complete
MDLNLVIDRFKIDRDILEINDISYISSAVLLPLVIYSNKLCILLQIRSETLNHHPGEIGFPGGATENSDLDSIDTMYRETKEEIGLNKNDITIIGKLDDVITSTQFLIKPYVGIIKKPMEYKLSSEVEKIMNVPVSDLNNPINWRYDYIIHKKCLIKLKTFYYDGNIVFGATAKILNNFFNIINLYKK